MNPRKDFPENRDAVRERLREEAMAERRPFSPEIHDRIMRGIRKKTSASQPSRMSISGRLTGAAAAILLLTGMIAIDRLLQGARTKSPGPVVTIGRDSHMETGIPSRDAVDLSAMPVHFTLNIGGVLSAGICPPRISIGLPVVVAGSLVPENLPTQTPDAPLGSPEWLFAQLQEPASNAQAKLIDLVPLDMRALFPPITAPHFPKTSERAS